MPSMPWVSVLPFLFPGPNLLQRKLFRPSDFDPARLNPATGSKMISPPPLFLHSFQRRGFIFNLLVIPSSRPTPLSHQPQVISSEQRSYSSHQLEVPLIFFLIPKPCPTFVPLRFSHSRFLVVCSFLRMSQHLFLRRFYGFFPLSQNFSIV